MAVFADQCGKSASKDGLSRFYVVWPLIGVEFKNNLLNLIFPEEKDKFETPFLHSTVISAQDGRQMSLFRIPFFDLSSMISRYFPFAFQFPAMIHEGSSELIKMQTLSFMSP